ncbi:MAG: family 78 glycoside hydrolase catalytic domain [Clostridia bacterium]|nr:family 78 glycoside hydrolase catalytic domain [Clostridia bacterium]
MKIIHCRTNHLVHPMGFRLDQPVLSWQVVESAGKRQTEARLRVWQGDDLAWDTGWTDRLDSLGVTVPLTLAPRTRYSWAVGVRSDAGEEAESARTWFETGKMDEPWQAKWLVCPQGDRLPIFHRSIPRHINLRRARLYICGLGLYEARINGVRVGAERLTPYCTDYTVWKQVITHDVTPLLREGGELSVMLGEGWWSGRFDHTSKPGDPGVYGHDLRLAAELWLEDEDGRCEVIATDEQWTVTRGRITFSGIYDGEHRDDTLRETEPVPATVSDEPLTGLEDRLSPAVRVQEELRPVALLHTPAGETVLDIGQNHAGIFRLRVHEPAGTKIRLQFGEVLQNGCFYRDNLRTAKAEYRYVSDGEEHELVPAFTFYGYRYVKVEGIRDLKPEDYTALVLYSEMDAIGALSTGNEKVNRLIENAAWGMRSNFIDVPTDCPQRDERMGWTGDANVFSETACFLRDTTAFYRKYLRDTRAEQDTNGGAVPFVIPAFGRSEACCVWGDATCVIPWNVWEASGDLSILREHYPAMRAWIDWVENVDGKDHGWRQRFHFGDWLALDHPDHDPVNPLGGTDEGYIADAAWLESVRITGRTAALLGDVEGMARCRALAGRILRGLREDYFTPGGRCAVNTQTGLLLALSLGLAEKPEVVLAQLDKLFAQTKGKLQTGFVGTPILCRTLSENGRNALAVSLLLREEYPGWLYEVNLGATTVWERWNSLDPDGTVSSTGMNSFNHYAYGSIVAWMVRCLAGLQPAQPGYRKAILRPMPDARLGSLNLRLRSAAGVWCVRWTCAENGAFHLEAEVPFGAEANLVLPEGAVLSADSFRLLGEAPEEGWTLSAGKIELDAQLKV